jgi:pimeloyl-ACP methyl ester carboxylesterase
MEDRLAPFIKSGRAAFGVVLLGHSERLRPAGADRPDHRTAEYFDELVGRVTDLRRGLDYLATRQDVDSARIAFFGPSAGGQLGLVLAAVEPRYRAVVLVGAGMPASDRDIFPDANPLNFAGHIRPPKLMFHGLYDEDTPLKTAGMPLFELLPSPKRRVTFAGGHVPTSDRMFAGIGPYLDEVMGPIRR